MIISELKITHVAEAAKLFMSVFSKEPWNDIYESVAEVESFIRRSIANKESLNFVAVENEEIVGLSLGIKKPWLKGEEYSINEFCIRSDKQSQGLGSLFLTEIERISLEKGLDSMILLTSPGVPAESFYLKNKFKVIPNLIVLAK